MQNDFCRGITKINRNGFACTLDMLEVLINMGKTLHTFIIYLLPYSLVNVSLTKIIKNRFVNPTIMAGFTRAYMFINV